MLTIAKIIKKLFPIIGLYKILEFPNLNSGYTCPNYFTLRIRYINEQPYGSSVIKLSWKYKWLELNMRFFLKVNKIIPLYYAFSSHFHFAPDLHQNSKINISFSINLCGDVCQNFWSRMRQIITNLKLEKCLHAVKQLFWQQNLK